MKIRRNTKRAKCFGNTLPFQWVQGMQVLQLLEFTKPIPLIKWRINLRATEDLFISWSLKNNSNFEARTNLSRTKRHKSNSPRNLIPTSWNTNQCFSPPNSLMLLLLLRTIWLKIGSEENLSTKQATIDLTNICKLWRKRASKKCSTFCQILKSWIKA